ncbi:MAG: class I SAM-dependent methyltransferase [Candidatus Heimdallarchaeaceae archaeon]
MKKEWDEYYKGKEVKAEVTAQQPIIESICRLMNVKRKRILEVGCGRAVDSIFLAKLGADITALDYSEIAIKLAKEISIKIGINICVVVGDSYNLPFQDGSFDVVFHQGFLEHFKNPTPLLKEQIRVLKPGGLLLVDVPQKYHIYTILKHLLIKLKQKGIKFNKIWETQYSYRELSELLRNQGLKIVYSYGWGSLLFWILRHYNVISSKTYIHWKSPFALYLALNLGLVGKKLDSGPNNV